MRPPRRTDQGYIASTWARSMLSTHAQQRHLRSRTGQQISKQIDDVMDRSDTRALLKVSDDDQDAILGWVLYVEVPGTPVIHFLYVRERGTDGLPLRGRGIAGALLKRLGVTPTTGVVCTSTGPSSQTMRSRYKASVHVPLAEFLSPEVKR